MPYVKISPTVTAGGAGYAAGDCVGGKQTLSGVTRIAGTDAILQSLVYVDQDNEKKELLIFLFDQDPANGTYTNDAALDVHDTDMDMCIGTVSVLASDYVTASDNAVATIPNIGILCRPYTGTTLYALIKAVEAVTYTAATDVQLIFGFVRVD